MRLSNFAAAAVLSAACITSARPVEAAPKVPTHIVVDSISLVDRVITGTIAGVPFEAPFTYTLQDAPGRGRRCTVLDLKLGPINLELLGLFVDTSEICLNITAFEREGLLGGLLCGLAGGNIGLDNADLLAGLTDVLNEALGQGKAKGNGGNGGDSVCSGECEVLDLVIGPLTLNLLGVQVRLDDCDNGPVEVCISATGGPPVLANLLGNLLCNLVGDSPTLGEILGFLDFIVDLIDELDLGGLAV